MTIQKVEIEVDVPEGWEFVRFGIANPGEWFFYRGLTVWQTQNVTVAPVFIVRKAKQYREPVLPADAGKVVEVRDCATSNWIPAILDGYLLSESFHWKGNPPGGYAAAQWKHCRIEVEAAS